MKSLQQNDFGDEEAEHLLQEQRSSVARIKRNDRWLFYASFALNIGFLCFASIFWITDTSRAAHSSYENGFSTDLYAASYKISIVTQDFGGGISLDEKGDFTADERGGKYVGVPSREIDDAWDALLLGLNIDIGATEAGTSSDRTFRWPESGMYFTGLDVFHSLHCLNRLRQALYPDYYPDVFGMPGDPSREIHVGHCINQIRQAIQCHADLTPMEWTLVSGEKLMLRTSTKHTCRDFEQILDWASQKATPFGDIGSIQNGSLFVVD